MKTKLFFILCLILSLTSCISRQIPVSLATDGIENRPSTDDTNTIEEKDPFLGLYHRDFGGEEFVIAAYDPMYIFAPDASDAMSLAVCERNSMVETRYNVKLVSADISKEQFYTKLYADYQSGVKTCDLIAAPIDIIAILYESDMLLNMNSLPFTDYNAPYYNKPATDSATALSQTYAVFGDFTPSYDNYWCVYFNKDIFDYYGIDYPYKNAASGNWTWEGIMNLCDSFNNGRVLFSSDKDEIIDTVWATGGHSFFENDTHTVPRMNFNTDKAKSIIELLKNIIESDIFEYETGGERLERGDFLFGVFPLSQAREMANTDFEWGIIPLPKTSLDGTYYTYDGKVSQAVCVLNNCNSERSGIIFEALSAASYKIKDEFKNMYMNYFLRDNSSVLMLDLICERAYFDLGYTLGHFRYEFAAASEEIIKSVVTKKVEFERQYEQNTGPFGLFIKNNYNVVE